MLEFYFESPLLRTFKINQTIGVLAADWWIDCRCARLLSSAQRKDMKSVLFLASGLILTVYLSVFTKLYHTFS